MIKLTAVGSGYYKVRVNGVIVSQHVSEREAMEAAANRELANPADVVDYFHDQVVKVEAEIVAEPTPEPPPVEPPPVDQPPASGNPLETLPPGTWFRFPNSKLSAIDPCPSRSCPYSGAEGQSGIMSNWSSGIFDTLRDELDVWGGGHYGYGGNEVPCFGPLTDPSTWKWRLRTQPSVPAFDVELYPDGTPSARHNYGTLQHDPVGDTMCALSGGSLFSQVTKPSRANHALRLSDNVWETNKPSWEFGDNHNTASDYDPVVGGFWVKNSFSTQFGLYRPRGNGGIGSWSGIGPAWYSSTYMTLTVAPDRRLMIGIGGNPTNNKRLNKFDLNNGCARSNPVTKGDAGGIALEVAQAPGFVYDPVGRRFIGWNGGRSVYQFNPDTDEWLKLKNNEASQEDPGAPATGGTFGRFRYVPKYHGVIVVNRTTDDVFFYKLTDETLPAVAPIPPALVNGKAQTLQAAIDAATAGATITVGEGPITGATVTKPLTILGAGKGKTIIKGVVGDKGILVVKADANIAGFSFQDAKGLQGNEAGIRHDAGKLTVADSDFARCYNGYLGNGDVSFLRDDFIDCGKGDGYTHAIYASNGAKLVEVDTCTMQGTKVGHHLKSRAENTVIRNTLMSPATESYSCDFPWGGIVEIDGLNAGQNAGTENAVLINYGSETNPAPFANHSFDIANSQLSTSDVTGALAIRIDAKTPVTVNSTNVAFNGFTTNVKGAQAIYSGCMNNGTPIPDTVIS